MQKYFWSRQKVVVHVCNPGGGCRRVNISRPVWAKLVETLPQKQNTNKGLGGVAQVAEPLPSMYEALGSISTPTKINKNFFSKDT
jgi:hypothetical protein